MKRIFALNFIACLLCSNLHAQWTQLGSEIIGDGPFGDQLGFRHALAIDSSGNTIAVGGHANSNVFQSSGYARVLDWDGTGWVQRGSDIIGTDSTYSNTGYAVDLSSDGMTFAVSSPWGYNSLLYKSGNVRVYDWSNSAWVQRGLDIEGEGNINPMFSTDNFGWSLELNNSGDYIIIGGPANTEGLGISTFGGHARVYHWDGNSWDQIGQDIDGPITLGTGTFGCSVGINKDGDRIVIGGRMYTGTNSNDQERGIAMTYEYDGSAWMLMGDTIFGSNSGDNLGEAVEISGDGNTIAIGAPKSNSFNGQTKIFDWDGLNWVQRGNSILGVSSSNMTSSGRTLALSNNSSVLAIGENGANFNKGAVKVYHWNNNSWQQIDNTISPQSPTTMPSFGWGVDVNHNGSRIIAAAPLDETGKVRVYENVKLDSTWHCYQSAGCQWAGSNPSFVGQYTSLSDCQAACNLTDFYTIDNTEKKTLVKITDILGKESKVMKNQLLFYIYNDGTVEKKIIIE